MPKKTYNLTSNMEDYLEAIYSLKQDKGFTRVGEIAEKLNVKNSSVNAALKTLAEKDLVEHERYGYVTLTKAGDKLAIEVKKKHDILYRFLTEFLMLSSQKAEEEACAIEHSISKLTFERLVSFFKFLEEGSNGIKPKILSNFEKYLKTGKNIRCTGNK